jgi:hypothetical protein
MSSPIRGRRTMKEEGAKGEEERVRGEEGDVEGEREKA